LTKIKNNNIIITESKIKKRRDIKMLDEREIIRLTKSYKNLMKFGRPIIEFNVYNGDIEKPLTLIRSLDGWNNFNSVRVAENLEKLFKMLPVRDYGKDNPNNGKPEFDKIIIEGDDTVILRAYRLKPFDDNVKEGIKKIINEYGKKMLADKINFLEEPIDGGIAKSYTYYIRFWWD
jgi:hypothetical protein